MGDDAAAAGRRTGVGVGASQVQGAVALLGDGEGRRSDVAADRQGVRIHRDDPVGVLYRRHPFPRLKSIRAANASLRLRLSTLFGLRTYARDRGVDRSTRDGEGAGADGGGVVEVQPSGAEGGATAVGVCAGEG